MIRTTCSVLVALGGLTLTSALTMADCRRSESRVDLVGDAAICCEPTPCAAAHPCSVMECDEEFWQAVRVWGECTSQLLQAIDRADRAGRGEPSGTGPDSGPGVIPGSGPTLPSDPLPPTTSARPRNRSRDTVLPMLGEFLHALRENEDWLRDVPGQRTRNTDPGSPTDWIGMSNMLLELAGRMQGVDLQPLDDPAELSPVPHRDRAIEQASGPFRSLEPELKGKPREGRQTEPGWSVPPRAAGDRDNPAVVRRQHLEAAIDHLRAAGLEDQAERLLRQLELNGLELRLHEISEQVERLTTEAREIEQELQRARRADDRP